MSNVVEASQAGQTNGANEAKGKTPAVVIGSGFGGLASAIRLQVRGYQVTLLEMRDKPGGRAYVFEDKGFTYDAGPTIITAPELIDELFALAGKDVKDYVNIVPVTPFYRIVFHDGRIFDYTGDPEHIESEIRKFNADDIPGYRKFVDWSKRIYNRAFIDLADRPFTSIWDMIKVAPDLAMLRSHESVYQLVSHFVKDPALRVVFSFHPLLVGGNPFNSSSIYSMIHYLERSGGVHFAMGGTGALVNAMIKLFEELGGAVRLNTRVEEVLVENRTVKGVRIARANGLMPLEGDQPVGTPAPATPTDAASREIIHASVVVSNADTANLYRKRIKPNHRKTMTNRKLERMRYSMGLFLIYFGTDRTYPDIAHHSIVLSERYEELLEDIFTKKVLAKDFSLYLHAPTRTDPSLAPEGCECFYVLSPVPHLDGDIDWEDEKERYADAILESLETLCPDLRKHIISKLIFTPADFETQLDAYKGSAFQFEPILTQSAWFRPHNISEDVKGLFLCGAGTHPGAGMPGVLSSAKLLERVIPDPKAA